MGSGCYTYASRPRSGALWGWRTFDMSQTFGWTLFQKPPLTSKGYENHFGNGTWKLEKGAMVVDWGYIYNMQYKNHVKIYGGSLNTVEDDILPKLWHKTQIHGGGRVIHVGKEDTHQCWQRHHLKLLWVLSTWKIPSSLIPFIYREKIKIVEKWSH